MMTFGEYVLKRAGVNSAPMDVDAERSRFNNIADPYKDPEKYARLERFANDKFGSIPNFISRARQNPRLWSKAWSAVNGDAQGPDEPRSYPE